MLRVVADINVADIDVPVRFLGLLILAHTPGVAAGGFADQTLHAATSGGDW